MRSTSFRCGLALVFAATVAASLPARSVRAQSATSDIEQARELFAEGVSLADRGDWTEAVERFRRALVLHDAPTIRYNMAQSLFRLGRLTEALQSLDALEAGGPTSSDVAEGAATLRRELVPRIGRLTVRVRGEAAGCVVELDAVNLAPDSVGVALPTDPGTRRVRLVCGATIVDDVTVAVPEGGAAHVVLATAPAVVAPVDEEALAEPPRPEDDGGSDVTSEPWFWVVIGIVAAGVVAGTTAGIVVAATPGPNSGDFGPGRLEFGP